MLLIFVCSFFASCVNKITFLFCLNIPNYQSDENERGPLMICFLLIRKSVIILRIEKHTLLIRAIELHRDNFFSRIHSILSPTYIRSQRIHTRNEIVQKGVSQVLFFLLFSFSLISSITFFSSLCRSHFTLHS